MQTYVLRCEMKAPRSPAETFAVFENPYNLALITPPWLNFKVLEPNLEMRKGLLIDYSIRWLAAPMRWRTLIIAYRPPFQFIDKQLKGPYRLWHHLHTFAEAPDGTVVGDEVTYVLPLGVLGSLAHSVMVKRQLLQIFRYRQRALARILGGATEIREPWVEAGSTITEQQLAQYGAQ